MRILFEEYRYDQAFLTRALDIGISPLSGGKAKVTHVGYYFNPRLNGGDCVFILPKVLLGEDEKVRGEFTPEELFDPFSPESPLLSVEWGPQFQFFLYMFSTWIYRSIVEYGRRFPANQIVVRSSGEPGALGGRVEGGTFLDVILAMLRFQRENKDYFVSCLRMASSGRDHVKWGRTVSRGLPVFEGGVPKYVKLVTRRKNIDLGDELFTIFYSILWYVHVQYGFPYLTDLGYELLDRRRFKTYLKGFGLIRLRQIRGRYFTDKAVRMWGLCHDFFARCQELHINTKRSEYFLASAFDRVFEDMIDVLLADDKSRLPQALVNQRDRKALDHLYQYRGLISDQQPDVFYVADSKYYKPGDGATGHDEFKQYTYVRNLIQENLRVYLDGEDGENWPDYHVLWDSDTEGYNLTPNFFVSARVYQELDYNDGEVRYQEGSTHWTRHFENRLFDRDSLILSKYDVNFLYVVSRYVRHDPASTLKWRQDVRKRFTSDIRRAIEEMFDIYCLHPREVGMALDPVSFFAEHMKELMGKIYNPYKGSPYDGRFFVLALRKSHETEEENESVIRLLEQRFHVFLCPLGVNPNDQWSDYYAAHPEIHYEEEDVAL